MATLVEASYGQTLGDDLYASAAARCRGSTTGPGASGSAFGGGWYGYVEKDLR